MKKQRNNKQKTPISSVSKKTKLSPVDVENLRRKKFWEQWAYEMTNKMLRDRINEENKSQISCEDDNQVFPPVSARIFPEPRIPRSESEESITTNLSLLTTSELPEDNNKAVNSKLKKIKVAKRFGLKKSTTSKNPNSISKMEEKPIEQKVNWELFAKEKQNSLLNKLMGGNKIRENQLSEDEWQMLVDCGKRNDFQLKKSSSTANVLSMFDQLPKLQNKQQPPPNQQRPVSATAAFQREETQSYNSKFDKDRQHLSTAPGKLQSYHIQNFQTDNFKQLQDERISKALRFLKSMTGFGDSRTVCRQTIDEIGRYTANDYGRLCKYPQRLKVAPQLSYVIKTDIIKRMGKPKIHTLSQHDIKNLDKANPKLDKSNRNLVIFNWLNEMHDDY